MLSLIDIEEDYKKKKKLELYVIILLSAISIILGLILFDVLTDYYNIVVLILFFISLLVNNFIPEISSYNLIKYHLSKLIESQNGKSKKKSIYHLDRLSYNIAKFENELEENFILNPSKKSLKQFLNLLKYQVYPRLMERDFNSYAEVLGDINFALNNESLTSLNETLKNFVIKEGDTNILLPYEEPSFFSRVIKSIIRWFKISFQKSFVFRLFCITTLLLIMGYQISTITSLKFDNTIIGTLIIVGLGIAKEYK